MTARSTEHFSDDLRDRLRLAGKLGRLAPLMEIDRDDLTDHDRVVLDFIGFSPAKLRLIENAMAVFSARAEIARRNALSDGTRESKRQIRSCVIEEIAAEFSMTTDQLDGFLRQRSRHVEALAESYLKVGTREPSQELGNRQQTEQSQ